MNFTLASNAMQSQESRALPVDTPLRRYVRFGPFHLDLQQQEFFKDGSRIRVQGKVCEALIILVENPGEVVTRETLRARLWPTETNINYDANVNTTVNKLRQVLGDSPDRPTFVETIPRKGYTFIAPVESVEKLPVSDSSKPETPPLELSKSNLIQNSKELLGEAAASGWFSAGLISLVIAAILFGAAITLFAHRGF